MRHAAEELEDLRTGTWGRELLGSTGFTALDDVSGGFRRGQVWIVIGSPGEGRSTIATQWALRMAVHGQHETHLISGHEPSRLVISRLMANLGKIPAGNLWNYELTDEDEARLEGSGRAVSEAPLLIAGPGIISSVSVELPEADLPRVLVIDDADLLAEVSPQRIAGVAATGVLIILTLPRHEVRGPDGLEPAWTRVADFVLEIDRPDHLDPYSLRPGEADLFLVRNRWGPQRSTTVAFQGHYARFVEMAPSHVWDRWW